MSTAVGALHARGVRLGYGRTDVLHGVDMVAREGRVTGLVGPNGSGKTTLLRLLFGALRPAEGEVLIGDRPLAQFDRTELARSMAVVVQEDSGDTALSVAEVVLLGRLPHHSALGRYSDSDHAIALDALRRVGAAHLVDRDLSELSGGERQRVMVARALTQQPRYLLMDEPTNHLDIHFQHEILQLTELSQTAVVVLHDLNLAARYCDDLVVLQSGHVVASGTPEDVLTTELIKDVYGVRATIVVDDGIPQFLFAPRFSLAANHG
ncbi:ABC transporter ATP-binding protein [Yimella sp. NH-Cas1]|uniref:ABC transporter ATP-binding protein n=1 Tax=Yimella sp. NH-Cas1 TaxID=2917726 RepID=UPI001EFB87C2|nr:ABC transporter ATP-binding protein [Yimella sp. NH-Cas1]MCG8654086.1 ABC transporter ATP-binding protein [Yimella sp. NH-Cas1]